MPEVDRREMNALVKDLNDVMMLQEDSGLQILVSESTHSLLSLLNVWLSSRQSGTLQLKSEFICCSQKAVCLNVAVCVASSFGLLKFAIARCAHTGRQHHGQSLLGFQQVLNSTISIADVTFLV